MTDRGGSRADSSLLEADMWNARAEANDLRAQRDELLAALMAGMTKDWSHPPKLHVIDCPGVGYKYGDGPPCRPRCEQARAAIDKARAS